MLTWTFKDEEGRIKDAMRICSLEGCKAAPKAAPKSKEPSPTALKQEAKTKSDAPGLQITEATADLTVNAGKAEERGWCSWSQCGPEDKGFSGWCQAKRDNCDKCKGLWCSEGDDANVTAVNEDNSSANGTVMSDRSPRSGNPSVECTMKKAGASINDDFEQYRSCADCHQETSSGVVCSPTGLPVAPSMCIAVECLKIDRSLVSSSNCLQTKP